MEYKINYKTYLLKISDSMGTVRFPADVRDFVNSDPDTDHSVEQMYLIGMDIKNNIRLKHLIAKGGYNAITVSPADIFSHLLRLNLRNFAIVHNHPSGDPSASEEDLIFTKKINQGATLLGLNFLDHIIVTQGKEYYSFKEKELI